LIEIENEKTKKDRTNTRNNNNAIYGKLKFFPEIKRLNTSINT
jgi:hypothetical protein